MSRLNKRTWKVAGLLLLAVIFLLASPRIVRLRNYANSDFFSFWLAARMTWHGQNPYQPDLWISQHFVHGATWVSDTTFLYPPALSVLLAPLGLLPLFEAFVAWVFLSQLALLWSLNALRRLWPRRVASLPTWLPILIGAFLFRPLILTLLNGQLGGLLIPLLASAMVLWHREDWFAGGFVLACALVKPNLGVPIVSLAALWTTIGRRQAATAGVAAGALSLFLISELRSPGWLNQYATILGAKGSQNLGFSPTIWGLAGMACRHQPGCVLTAGAISSAVLAMIVLALILRGKTDLPSHLVLALAIGAATFLTPYLWGYDQVLFLLPIMVLTMELRSRGAPYLATAALPILYSLIAALLLYISSLLQKDTWSALVGLLVLLPLIGLCYRRLRTRKQEAPTAAVSAGDPAV